MQHLSQRIFNSNQMRECEGSLHFVLLVINQTHVIFIPNAVILCCYFNLSIINEKYCFFKRKKEFHKSCQNHFHLFSSSHFLLNWSCYTLLLVALTPGPPWVWELSKCLSFYICYLHLWLLQLFEWMQQTGKTNVSSYSSYIKFMGRGLNPLKALEVYNNIQEVSIKNNIFICNSILNCLVRNGKFDTSVKLFHQMKNDGLCPDTVSYSTVWHFNSQHPT